MYTKFKNNCKIYESGIIVLNSQSFEGSGMLEFEEFCDLSAKFLIEEDEESLKEELREAFRIYDKEGIVHAQKRFWS